MDRRVINPRFSLNGQGAAANAVDNPIRSFLEKRGSHNVPTGTWERLINGPADEAQAIQAAGEVVKELGRPADPNDESTAELDHIWLYIDHPRDQS